MKYQNNTWYIAYLNRTHKEKPLIIKAFDTWEAANAFRQYEEKEGYSIERLYRYDNRWLVDRWGSHIDLDWFYKEGFDYWG